MTLLCQRAMRQAPAAPDPAPPNGPAPPTLSPQPQLRQPLLTSGFHSHSCVLAATSVTTQVTMTSDSDSTPRPFCSTTPGVPGTLERLRRISSSLRRTRLFSVAL